MEQVLAELEAAEAELARLTSGARADARELEQRDVRLAEREARLARREKELEREGREAADRYLLEARREVEAVIEELREQAAPPGDTGAADEAGAATGARRRVEELLRDNRAVLPDERVGGRGGAGDGESAADVEVGDRVRSRSLGVAGDVVEVRPAGVVVEARGMRFTLGADDIEAAPDAPGERPSSAPSPPPPELDARPEVDLRGLRVDEIRGPLLAALDAAIVADLGRLVVIHGKGTGALREEVGRLVEGDERIVDVRPGGFAEGGSGVTVLQLKGAAH